MHKNMNIYQNKRFNKRKNKIMSKQVKKMRKCLKTAKINVFS